MPMFDPHDFAALNVFMHILPANAFESDTLLGHFCFQAELCQNEACAVRIHLYCLKKMFSQRRVSRDAFFFVFDSLKSFTHCDEFQGGRVCPSCGTQWQCKLPKEEPVEEDDEPDEPTQSTAPPERIGKRLRSNSTGESNSSKTTQPSSDLRRATRSSSHARQLYSSVPLNTL